MMHGQKNIKSLKMVY